MKKLIFFLMLLILNLSVVNAAITSIDYPVDNGYITHTNNVALEVSSSGSTNCVLYYSTQYGIVPENHSIACSGVTPVNFPSVDGTINITVEDDAGSTVTNTVIITRPGGLLVTFIYAFSILVILAIIFILVLNIAKLAVMDVTVYNVLVSLTAFFALLLAYQLNINYINVPFMTNWLDLFIDFSGWVMVVFPLIAFFITMFVKAVTKKRLLTPQEMTGGLYKYG